VHTSQDESFYQAIFFIDENYGWAVGDSGSILYSTDGGKVWDYQEGQTASSLLDVQFITHRTGWIVGANHTILKTENGGKVWYKIPINNDNSGIFLSLSFINAQIGWIADNTGHIFRTTDSGNSWTEQESHTHWAITSMQFLNENHGWAITTNKIALATTDGGMHWNQIPVPSISDNIPVVCTDLFFIDESHGWICGMYAGSIMQATVPLYYTKNTGLKWETQTNIPTYVITSVYFINPEVGWVTAERKIFISIDGGYTWRIQHETETGIFIDIHFVDVTHG
jgi:photosystem II stability/assembly factor-like uncharacterized protein